MFLVMKKSRHTYKCIMSHTSMSHVMLMNKSRHVGIISSRTRDAGREREGEREQERERERER